MTHRAAAESEAANIEAMGEKLGRQYSLLWQETAFVYREWLEFVELFGTSEKRIETLNRSAFGFFAMIQHTLFNDVLLRICRLTDAGKTNLKIDRSNLTIRNLPNLVDINLRPDLTPLIEQAMQNSQFCRDWRNRHIAHCDLALALGETSEPLKVATRLTVKLALDSVVAVLNRISFYYLKSDSAFDFSDGIGGAQSLVYILDEGLKRREDHKRRRLLGENLVENGR